jgi:hypothetical protein
MLSQKVSLSSGKTAGTLRDQEAHCASLGPGRLLDGFPGEAGTLSSLVSKISGHRHGGGDWRGLPPGTRHLGRQDADGNLECDGGLWSQRKEVAKEMGHQVACELITAVIIGFVSETMCK